jgi:N-acylglucosamine-6-phosphate 2-epimerase
VINVPTSRATELLLNQLRGGLIVSCQARQGTALHGPAHMSAMARAATDGGAVGIRAEGLDDVRAIRDAVQLPLIGLWKTDNPGVFITPTAEHAVAVAETGADIVATDATTRTRPDGKTVAATIDAIHRHGALAMADIATIDDALAAEQAGADLIGTTLSGYTNDSPAQPGPDLELVAALTKRVDAPVVAEGRVHTPTQARQALDAGAWTVVVGTAITAPTWITAQFADALNQCG